ncbi:DNA-processing protein DprA [Paracoccus aestuariivivens]|uniref:DNA-protecting protein DprA n=1 Tax=Paracoccus aestuariivivens TaxID=1820333 RepID=A0A6L6JDB6_9RHOB|nr:DNA-processing protein DprA [Paracoccus aestuariivivens]MTH78607.1 DNA-protecting protein DprA [Paracoccus aestuariivivens]
MARLLQDRQVYGPPSANPDKCLANLRLIRSRRVGPATFHRLLAEHGNAEAALDALPALARAAGLDDYEPCPIEAALAEMDAGRRAGARMIIWDDPDYPERLREITDAPPVLWVRGKLSVLENLPVAVIGARNASSLGLRMARGLAIGLSEAGAAIIAGLARGIDTTAHEASLGSGTVAVMAGGIDQIYPSENAALAEAICETGFLVTEQPPGTEPVARHFPARNRIISGLSRAVVVIEAAQRSGSLITAKAALDQGREVMAVPGHPMDARASGCNALIRDGATLVRNAQDVLTALSVDLPEPFPQKSLALVETPLPEPIRATGPDSNNNARRLAQFPQGTVAGLKAITSSDRGGPAQLEARILARLGPSPTDENHVIRDLGLPAAALAPAILSLELAGRVQRLAGGRIALVQD